MTGEALALLEARRAKLRADHQPERVRRSPFVFPGTGSSRHLAEPKTGWRRVLARAQMLGFLGALAAAEGWSENQRREVEAAALANPAAALKSHQRAARRHQVDAAAYALCDLRIHDLRRTLGSWQAKTGASLPVIAKALNHRNIATTAIYARLDRDPVRQSVAIATAAMLEAAGITAAGIKAAAITPAAAAADAAGDTG